MASLKQLIRGQNVNSKSTDHFKMPAILNLRSENEKEPREPMRWPKLSTLHSKGGLASGKTRQTFKPASKKFFKINEMQAPQNQNYNNNSNSKNCGHLSCRLDSLRQSPANPKMKTQSWHSDQRALFPEFKEQTQHCSNLRNLDEDANYLTSGVFTSLLVKSRLDAFASVEYCAISNSIHVQFHALLNKTNKAYKRVRIVLEIFKDRLFYRRLISTSQRKAIKPFKEKQFKYLFVIKLGKDRQKLERMQLNLLIMGQCGEWETGQLLGCIQLDSSQLLAIKSRSLD